jgi:hypothetical protein
MTPLHVTSRRRIMLVEYIMYLTLPNIVPFWLCFNIRSTAIQCLQLYIVLNFLLSIPIPCYIFIKQMSLFVWGVSTYNFVFYVIGRRLNNCQFLLVLCVHMLFLSSMLSYFPVFFVVTGRCVDKGGPDR